MVFELYDMDEILIWVSLMSTCYDSQHITFISLYGNQIMTNIIHIRQIMSGHYGLEIY